MKRKMKKKGNYKYFEGEITNIITIYPFFFSSSLFAAAAFSLFALQTTHPIANSSPILFKYHN